MPNWCFNELTVKGDKKALALLKTKAKLDRPERPSDFSLNKLVPMPEALKGTTAPADTPNWYDWALENWGTKWDVEMNLAFDSEKELLFSGDSAWSPFNEALLKISTDFPTLTFVNEYSEPGMQFRGVYEVKGGTVKRDYCGAY